VYNPTAQAVTCQGCGATVYVISPNVKASQIHPGVLLHYSSALKSWHGLCRQNGQELRPYASFYNS
jgi:hypothetical protein